MLESFAIRASIECAACRIAIPLNGVVTSARCYHCGETNRYDARFWAAAVGPARIGEALRWAPGEMKDSHEPTRGLRVAFGRVPARCGRCGGPSVDPGALAGAAFRGSWACAQCGAGIRVRDADAVSQAIHPAVRFVVGEQAPDAGGQELQARRAPVVFQCMSCGGALHVDGSKRLVACTYCNADNYLPDGLWQMLHPVPKAEVFYVFCQVESVEERRLRAGRSALTAEECRALADDDDIGVRQVLAGNPVASPEALQKLKWDKHRRVLEALAGNPNLPEPIVEEMADSADVEFRVLAARNPRLPLGHLKKLADDPMPEVQQAARARIEELRAQGVQIGGFFARLFGG